MRARARPGYRGRRCGRHAASSFERCASRNLRRFNRSQFNRDVVIPPNGEPATARGSAVTIKCLQLRVDYTDFWIAFYCSPEDGHSDADEKVALTAVATDPAVAAL